MVHGELGSSSDGPREQGPSGDKGRKYSSDGAKGIYNYKTWINVMTGRKGLDNLDNKASPAPPSVSISNAEGIISETQKSGVNTARTLKSTSGVDSTDIPSEPFSGETSRRKGKAPEKTPSGSRLQRNTLSSTLEGLGERSTDPKRGSELQEHTSFLESAKKSVSKIKESRSSSSEAERLAVVNQSRSNLDEIVSAWKIGLESFKDQLRIQDNKTIVNEQERIFLTALAEMEDLRPEVLKLVKETGEQLPIRKKEIQNLRLDGGEKFYAAKNGKNEEDVKLCLDCTKYALKKLQEMEELVGKIEKPKEQKAYIPKENEAAMEEYKKIFSDICGKIKDLYPEYEHSQQEKKPGEESHIDRLKIEFMKSKGEKIINIFEEYKSDEAAQDKSHKAAQDYRNLVKKASDMLHDMKLSTGTKKEYEWQKSSRQDPSVFEGVDPPSPGSSQEGDKLVSPLEKPESLSENLAQDGPTGKSKADESTAEQPKRKGVTLNNTKLEQVRYFFKEASSRILLREEDVPISAETGSEQQEARGDNGEQGLSG